MSEPNTKPTNSTCSESKTGTSPLSPSLPLERAIQHFIKKKDKESTYTLVQAYMMHQEQEQEQKIPECQKSNPTIAFCFDIDGVLMRGRTPLPGAADTLRLLQSKKIPFIFLTNGGGMTEKDHVEQLSRRLDLPGLEEDQFVQSHTPFRDLVPTLKDKNILVLGGVGNKIREVAKAYGFNNVITPADIYKWYPRVYPFAEMTASHHEEHGSDENSIADDNGDVQISAILVFSSPRDWGLDLQLCMDLLLSDRGYLGTTSPLNGDESLPNKGYFQGEDAVTIHFCNPDLTWATDYHQPRVAQGSFRAALEGIFIVQTGASLRNQTVVGKPREATYVYGEWTLQEWHNKVNGEEANKIDVVYMIGDNPASDIQGTMNYKSRYGAEWKSVLVESGVYTKEEGRRPQYEPTAFAHTVRDAVELVLKVEGWRGSIDTERGDVDM